MAEDDAMVPVVDDAEYEPQGLESKCVEVFDMEYTYARTCARRERDRKLVQLNGQRARCGRWLAEEEKYAVQTFEGTWAAVPQENLRETHVPTTEDGGFDLLWPGDEMNFAEMSDFTENAANCLARKGYCMVQMFTSLEDRKVATEAAELCPDLRGTLRRELESAYLGYNNTTQMCALGSDDGIGDVDEGDPLASLRRQFTLLWTSFAQSAPAYLGFRADSWSSVWARPLSEDAEEAEIEALAFGTSKDDISMIESNEQFLAGRTVCALHMLDNDGGEIRLRPRDDDSKETILPVARNRMLLFRHDLMSYAYMPIGRSMAFQCWLMAAEQIAKTDLQSAIVERLTGVKKPPQGMNAQIMSLHTRMPGSVDNGGAFWSMFQIGTDTNSQWPAARWETEPYYTAEDNYQMVFKAYTKHGAFMDQEQIENFDNKFFGISDVESNYMGPGQRMVLEVAYTAMMQAGHTRASMNGENTGFFIGDVGMDWHSLAEAWSWGPNLDYANADTVMLNNGIHVGVTSNRFSHIFNLTGPTNTVDTACSASLVALQAGHKQMMHYSTDDNKEGSVNAPHSILCGGINTLLGPMSYIGNCMAGMLSHVGRCWTFDRTADGYQRGEGCAFLYMKWSGDELDFEERLACLIGTCSNHDGRSASLTAPNGPAQQDCIRRSMRMAELDPSKISIAECHGTGTALGDPIEVGALQGVMKGQRDFPLFNTSAKTNVSHTEALAGVCGLAKCVQMVISACAPPNCSLRVLNPNLEQTMHDGYPVYFEQELSDCGFNTTCIGVSSFGFGGTNSRADVYGRALRGPRDTGNIWTAERIKARDDAYKYGLRNSFKGKLPDQPTRERNIFIVGTWNAYTESLKMWCTSPGTYEARVMLGDTRSEKFQLLLEGDAAMPIYPAADNAGPAALIQGPDSASEAQQWRINGSQDGMPSGTIYKITFEWKGTHRSISWAVSAGTPDPQPYTHKYHFHNPSNGFTEEMGLISAEEGLYEMALRVAYTSAVQFQFIRDGDNDQIIYPAMPRTTMTDLHVAVKGPDSLQNHTWHVGGDFGEVFKVQLCVMNANIAVSLIAENGDSRTWKSAGEPLYYVTGSFNDWKLTAMVPDPRIYGLFRHHLKLGTSQREDFQVMVDTEGTGEVTAMAMDVDANFHIEAKAGSTWEIFLDLNQDDTRKRIYWRQSTYREQHLDRA